MDVGTAAIAAAVITGGFGLATAVVTTRRGRVSKGFAERGEPSTGASADPEHTSSVHRILERPDPPPEVAPTDGSQQASPIEFVSAFEVDAGSAGRAVSSVRRGERPAVSWPPESDQLVASARRILLEARGRLTGPPLLQPRTSDDYVDITQYYAPVVDQIDEERRRVAARIPLLVSALERSGRSADCDAIVAEYVAFANFELHHELAYLIVASAPMSDHDRDELAPTLWKRLALDGHFSDYTAIGWPTPVWTQQIVRIGDDTIPLSGPDCVYRVPKDWCDIRELEIGGRQVSTAVTDIAFTRAVIPQREMKLAGTKVVATYQGGATAYKTSDRHGSEY